VPARRQRQLRRRHRVRVPDVPARAEDPRDARYVLNIAGAWDAAADDAAQVAWARDSWEALRRFSTGGVYLNFLTDDEGAERISAAYGKAIFDRLSALKRRFDPMNLFRHTKSFG